jgi:hypothetical protein
MTTWHFDLSIGGIVNIRRLLNDLSHRFQDEVQKHFVHDRPATGHGSTNRNTSGAQFADSGVA